MALNIHQTTQPPFTRADANERTTRRRYLVLAMAAGVFAIIFGAWNWAPDSDSPTPSHRPANSIVSPAQP